MWIAATENGAIRKKCGSQPDFCYSPYTRLRHSPDHLYFKWVDIITVNIIYKGLLLQVRIVLIASYALSFLYNNLMVSNCLPIFQTFKVVETFAQSKATK